MDMYQKRKMRQEKKNSESNQESFPNVGINCLITIYLRTSTKPYFIRNYKKVDNTCFM